MKVKLLVSIFFVFLIIESFAQGINLNPFDRFKIKGGEPLSIKEYVYETIEIDTFMVDSTYNFKTEQLIISNFENGKLFHSQRFYRDVKKSSSNFKYDKVGHLVFSEFIAYRTIKKKPYPQTETKREVEIKEEEDRLIGESTIELHEFVKEDQAYLHRRNNGGVHKVTLLDEQGRVVRVKNLLEIDSLHKISSEFIFEYDSLNHCTKLTNSSRGELKYVFDYIYNKEGQLIKKVKTNQDNEMVSFETYNYMENGVEEIISFTAATRYKARRKSHKSFDDKGNLIKEMIWYENSNKLRVSEFKIEYAEK